MTVIVAAVTGKDRVTMAADSECSAGWQKSNLVTPKIWVDKGYAFGAAGCLRTGQVLQHHVAWPPYHPADEPDFERFVITTLVPAMWEGLDGHGVIHIKNGIVSHEGVFIVAHGGQLAEVWGNGAASAAEPGGRIAIGSGYAEALGSLGDEGPWREADLVEAARRATVSAVGVGGPIRVVDTKSLEVREA